MFGKVVLACLCLSGVALANTTTTTSTLTSAQSWGYGFLAGFGIALSALLGSIGIVCSRTCVKPRTFKIIASLLYAMGCGTMIGDAMVHIIPDAYANTALNGNYISLVICCSITFYILMERFMLACGIANEHEGEFDFETGDYDDGENKVNAESQDVIRVQEESPKKAVKDEKAGKTEENKDDGCCASLKGKHSTGYMVFLTESLCLIFDCFGIGVSIMGGDSDKYIPLIIAVYAHEVPIFMGNVGLLLRSGFTNFQTVMGNTLISIGGILGVLIGLGIGEVAGSSEDYILTFVAGNFIYIASDMWKKMMRSDMTLLSIFEFLTYALGIGIMYLILLVEEDH